MGGRGRWGRRKSIQLTAEGFAEVVETLTERPYTMPARPSDELATRGYMVVGSVWDGEKTPFYPLFPQDRAWQLVARDGRQLDESPLDPAHSFGMERPTLAWQNGTQRMELYVDGMDHQQFMAAYGMEFLITKNGFITSKRMSRMLRDYRASARLPEESVSVDYLDLDKAGEEIWDGAGLISRAALERLMLSPHLSEAGREQLRAELAHIGRVEFTLVNSQGQHKGHAIVVDGLDVDFRLPRDIKKDARTTDGTAFIGINPVHSKDDMRLDIQSIMNLHPFISAEQMLGYLEEEGTLFREAIETGKKAQAMARLERASPEDLEAWPLRDFFARGGDAKWFPGMVKELINGHIERLETSLERGKLRVPFPGGRYYVMTTDVAKAAGLDIQVGRGQVHLDPRTSTAWVNSDDWLKMPDSPDSGIKHILGGADQDDALWVHGFTDHDGERKILAWRSPNNTGEYVVLAPTATSQPMLWDTPQGETVMYPPADSRRLIKRIDQMKGEIQYLGLAREPRPGELGQGQDYSPAIMDEVNQRTLENAGILGAYCNFTMGFKGAMGRVPRVLPDTLEAVIDNDVKLGGSNAEVGQHIRAMTQTFIKRGLPAPALLWPRFGVYPDDEGHFPPHINLTQGDHWVDVLHQGVIRHTRELTAYRDAQMDAARLPAAVHDSVAGDAEALHLGARFNAIYTRTLREARNKYAHLLTANPQKEHLLYQKQQRKYNQLVLDYVRERCEAFLDEQPAERQTAVLRGAMVSRELGGKSSDSAFWQRGRVAQTALRALQEVGLLGEIHEEVRPDGSRLVRYPTPEQAAKQASYAPVEIRQVWFNRARRAAGRELSMGDFDPATKTQRKHEVRHLAQRPHEQGGFLGQRLRVSERTLGSDPTPRKVFEDDSGEIFGVIDRQQATQWATGQTVIIRQAKGSDGNLQAVVERV